MDPGPDPTPPPEPPPIEPVISVDRLVVGGAALGHEDSGRVALVQLALECLPPRSDPDALTVPDHL